MHAGPSQRSRIGKFILGFLVAVVVAACVATAVPAIMSARAKARMTDLLGACRQFHMAMQQAALDESSQDKPQSIFPADSGVKSAREYLERFVAGNYITREQANEFGKMLLIGNVSASDPSETIILKLKPGVIKDGTFVFRKAGDGAVLQNRQIVNVRGDPPRNPAYLAE